MKRAGEVIILFIYLIGEFHTFWGISHLFALLLSVVGVIALLLLDGELPPKTQFTVCCMTSVICLAVLFLAPPILPEESETHGWLLPGHGDTPQNGCTKRGAVPPDALLFVAGTNAVWTIGQGRSRVLNIAGQDQLWVERDGDRLAFDADIHDSNGLLVARIVKNQWRLINGKFSYRERSDDLSKITVYDGRGSEMLCIDYVNPKAVRIRGLFTATDGTRIQIDEEKILILDVNNSLHGNCKGQKPSLLGGFTLSKNSITF